MNNVFSTSIYKNDQLPTRIPFIPKQTPDFKPMRYFFCETDTSAKAISRAAFLRLLEQQTCPMAQVNIDLDGGYVYLFPYCPERADAFIQLNREVDVAYKRNQRKQLDIRTGKKQTVLHLDQELNENGLTFGDTLTADETPEDLLLTRERFTGHRAAFNALTGSDRDVLLGYISVGYNARKLARRLGKDASGVTKLVKRAASRLQKIIDENC